MLEDSRFAQTHLGRSMDVVSRGCIHDPTPLGKVSGLEQELEFHPFHLYGCPELRRENCPLKNVIRAMPSLGIEHESPCSLGYACVEPTMIGIVSQNMRRRACRGGPRSWPVGKLTTAVGQDAMLRHSRASWQKIARLWSHQDCIQRNSLACPCWRYPSEPCSWAGERSASRGGWRRHRHTTQRSTYSPMSFAGRLQFHL